MKHVYVTQPGLPSLSEFIPYLESIWDSKWLTNNGQFHKQLEEELTKYLGVKYLSLFSNGTLALITALQTLRISGEVISSPYSFVATTHALWWNNIKPVFVDIDPETLNLDPKKIESAITAKTTAILPVHVYGNPCDVKSYEKIASKYGLKIIYDACHTFGETIQGESILNFGDLSIMSFHATKVFNTFEGGAIISHDYETKKRIDLLKNFGFAGETTVVAPGINAKMNEIQAAFGLLQLKYVDDFIQKRNKIANTYNELLKDIQGIEIHFKTVPEKHCFAYYPILIDEMKFGKTRDDVYEELKKNNVFSRRYFYPLISQFSTYNSLDSASPHNLPVAERVTRQILCLPIFPDLPIDTVERICHIVKSMRLAVKKL